MKITTVDKSIHSKGIGEVHPFEPEDPKLLP
ncbi:hypothetical protein T4A_7997 [Trichinella pseudospiralis]|uniref:Uncharacterized protein n=1 Tax=Trichinella pseudospiralis TaxID=6337 RepID=A0A0V1DMI8_TRIPS|nr:hypothetical protein T4A_7997 [Trichinella pseudospiralis]KRY94812.1 hypothetical protein T4C_8511 [Trichinella pseudospiralis]